MDEVSTNVDQVPEVYMPTEEINIPNASNDEHGKASSSSPHLEEGLISVPYSCFDIS